MSRTRRNFSAKFKSELVIELLKGEKDLNTIASLWNFFCKITIIRSFYDKINIIRRAFYYGKTKETCIFSEKSMAFFLSSTQILLLDISTLLFFKTFEALIELSWLEVNKIFFSKRLVLFPFASTNGCRSENVRLQHVSLSQKNFLVKTSKTTFFPYMGRSCTSLWYLEWMLLDSFSQ